MAPNVKVSPGLPDYTHHISLTNRKGETIGLILCDEKGQIADPKGAFHKIPVDRTSLKTSSGNSSYSDFEYPYSPIVQLDWSGGRGQLDFENDNTKYYDGFRMRTGRPGKAFLGPQEQYTDGYRNQDYNVPGNVVFKKLLSERRLIVRQFTPTVTHNLGIAWFLLRTVGHPQNLIIELHDWNIGQIGALITSISVPASRMADTLSEWIDEIMTASLTAATNYWILLKADASDDDRNHWEVAVNINPPLFPTGTYESATGGVMGGPLPDWFPAAYDLYFRLTTPNLDRSVIFYEYMEQQYAVISGATAPRLFMNGDRGAADSNAGQLSKLIDATKTWTTNQWLNCIVMISAGTGKNESQPWRKITANDGISLTVDTAWIIQHDTTTEYIILGAPSWRELLGHGMNTNITRVLSTTQGVVLFAMGGAANIRRHREYNNAGTWMESTAAEWADDGTNTATFLIYKPKEQKIYRGQNGDVNGDVSVSSADPVPWATPSHTFSTPTKVGSKYRKITGLAIYPEDNGAEAVWVGKTDRPWIVPTTGNPYPMAVPEMENARSPKNFRASIVENVYLFFSFGNGLERYYNGSLDDIGPNLGEGLPQGRQGAVIAMSGYPGKLFAAVDGGTNGYSALFDRDNNGWHERYRAPLGQRILGMAHQVIPGSNLDRLWLYVGNDLIWLPFPSDTTNELNDPAYLYTHEGAMVLSRMHAGMFDVQKIVRLIKLWTSQLAKGVCWIEIDYRLGEDTAWTVLQIRIEESPIQVMDLKEIFGLAAKRIQLRLRFYTTNALKTPILLVAILDAVIRSKVKYMYPLQFRIEDDAAVLNGGGQDDYKIGIDKIHVLEDWADDSSDSMLKMRAISPLFDDMMVFLNAPEVVQLQVQMDRSQHAQKNVYLVKTSLQEA